MLWKVKKQIFNCPILGVILNKVDSKKSGYGRYYGKYYVKYYGKYYGDATDKYLEE